MKKSGWIATAAAAVVLIGGGTAATVALTSSDDTPTAPTIAETTEPAASATPEEVVTVDPSESATSIPTATAYTEDEDYFLYGARQKLAGTGVEPDDAELLALGEQICAGFDAGEGFTTIRVFDPAVGEIMQNDINLTARDSICS